MSVSLSIDWPGGEEEEVFLGSLRQLEEGWAPIAKTLGLELIPRMSGWMQVTPENLEPLLGELAVYRAELVRLGLTHGDDIRIVDEFIAALGRLRGSEGWTATVG